MQFLFVMDSAESMLPDKDTTFAFMRGALARGHCCWHCLPRAITTLGQECWASAAFHRRKRFTAPRHNRRKG